MNKIVMNLIDQGQKLLQHPRPLSLKAINIILPRIVPFNHSHGIRVTFLKNQEVQSMLPFKYANKNHVGTMHACAIATLGEFTAGILLMREISLTKYRMILKELSTEYHLQARSDLVASAKLPAGFSTEKQELLDKGILLIPLITTISTKTGKKIATTTSLWHLKRWDLTHIK